MIIDLSEGTIDGEPVYIKMYGSIYKVEQYQIASAMNDLVNKWTSDNIIRLCTWQEVEELEKEEG
ncbi:hypothetical protein CMI37_05170 [Candidatus Pacearchaeota archaeon]|nr:hypothetical protein [Candidatus Pacearchaeota archaeon]|tara:strand:- start:4056 stop:4250 length:195 start_codon:yes stop_codon:yes gene_type:complete